MSDLPETRHSLILRLKDRSDGAWLEFVELYEQTLLDYALRKGLQDADARDVAQEVLAALESKIPEWNLDADHGKLRGWLLRVARNIAVDKISERVRSPLPLGGAGSSGIEHLLCEASHSDQFLLQYRRRLLHWAADRVQRQVTPQTWTAFWQTAMEGRDSSSVANELGMSIGNVYAAKFRVTAKMQEMVTKMSGMDDSEWPSPLRQLDTPQSSLSQRSFSDREDNRGDKP
ncbi:MAG: sigma-70 family RNA polymerase sigma factor [Planctomycetota bacterium]